MSDLVQRYWRATGPDDPKYARIAEMYQAGGTFLSISTDMHCSWRTVRNALRSQGVAPRLCTVKVRPRKKMAPQPRGPKVTHALGSGFYLNPGDCPRCGAPAAVDPGPVAGLCRLCCHDLAMGWVQKTGELPAERVEAIRAELARMGYEVAA